ncbi:MlaE family ABC transporter permease [Rhizosaccharibacter radicis]|uniref:ABC transporter permease n=1 Tax=Rhizosaccharibacter radicis TaxID=2782605 RepID=A0ABT1VZL7_9PROT|nr:ABC transporter permease [Acetobacteraceae bacterium KSS12]
MKRHGLRSVLVFRLRAALAAIGHWARTQLRFPLALLAAGWGVMLDGVRPSSWRRTARAEFRRTLRQAAGGGLVSTLFTAALAGLAMVSQALYWLGLTGLDRLTGGLIVTILLREVTPVLVGLILLGRSGMLSVTELGALATGGQLRSLIGQGIDPFSLLVMTRSLALAVSGFTLGIAFAMGALFVGFLFSSLLGSIQGSLWRFIDEVLTAMTAADYVAIPLKLLFVGFVVGLSSCLTGLEAAPEEDQSVLMPRGFARGILAVMTVNIAFTAIG